MTWLRENAPLIALTVLLGRFTLSGTISGPLALAIVVLAIAILLEVYLPVPADPVAPQQEELDKIMNTIKANQELFTNRFVDLEARIKKADDKASSAVTATAMRPRPLGMQGGHS